MKRATKRPAAADPNRFDGVDAANLLSEVRALYEIMGLLLQSTPPGANATFVAGQFMVCRALGDLLAAYEVV